MQEILLTAGVSQGPAHDKTLMLLQADASQVALGLPIDKARPGRVFTKYLTPSVVTTQPKFGQHSFDCRTGGFEMTGQQKTDLVFPTKTPYTVEFWAYNTAVDGATWWMYFNTGTSSCMKTFQSTMYLQDNSISITLGGLGTIPLNRWNHVAIVYDGATLALYLNGSRIANQASNGGWSLPVAFARVMGGEGTSKCYMDQFRISNIARYSGTTFTVPDAPFILD